MIFICTGIEQLDELLKHELKKNKIESSIIFYADYLLESKNTHLYDTIIIAPREDMKLPFKDFLFLLRQKDKRVIVLPGKEESNNHLGYILALGIYDIVFDPVTPEKIINAIKNPAKFSDVQKYFLGLKEKVSFSEEAAKMDTIEEEPKINTVKETFKLNIPKEITKVNTAKETTKVNIPAKLDSIKEETAINQIKGIMKLLGQKTTKNNINEALVELEDAVIKLLF